MSVNEDYDTYSDAEMRELEEASEKIFNIFRKFGLTSEEVELEYFKGQNTEGKEAKFYEVFILRSGEHWINQAIYAGVPEEEGVFSEAVGLESWSQSADFVVMWFDNLQKVIRQDNPELEQWLQENNFVEGTL